jgi:hypothetical protein
MDFNFDYLHTMKPCTVYTTVSSANSIVFGEGTAETADM